MLVWQHPDLCERLDKSPLKQFDYNVYVKDAGSGLDPLIYWSPSSGPDCQTAVTTLAGLQQVFTGSSAHSQVYEGIDLPLFKSRELGNFQLNPAFPGAHAATRLPVDIQQLLDLSPEYEPYVGAYPVP